MVVVVGVVQKCVDICHGDGGGKREWFSGVSYSFSNAYAIPSGPVLWNAVVFSVKDRVVNVVGRLIVLLYVG